MTPVMAGASIPAVPQVSPDAALYRPRKCSGAMSLTNAGDTGLHSVSPIAKTAVDRHSRTSAPVSYTHLTLPTIYSV